VAPVAATPAETEALASAALSTHRKAPENQPQSHQHHSHDDHSLADEIAAAHTTTESPTEIDTPTSSLVTPKPDLATNSSDSTNPSTNPSADLARRILTRHLAKFPNISPDLITQALTDP
jgi:hypothetical protein